MMPSLNHYAKNIIKQQLDKIGENNEGVSIYDTTGKIWSVTYGITETPQGLLCMFVDMPDGAMLEYIDVTDSKNPKPVFSYLPESDIGKLQKKVNELQAANEELSSTMDSLLTEVIPDLMRVE